MKDKLKAFAVSAKEIGAVLLHPILHTRIKRLEDENKILRDQLFALKAWIRSAHRLDKKPIAETIKSALAHEKA